MTLARGILFLGLLAAGGCSSVGRLTLGTTTSTQIMDYFGEPRGIDTIRGPAIPVPTSLFTYGFRTEQPPEMFRGIWKRTEKQLVFEFLNDTLHGYLFNNSADRPTTDFDKHLRRKIALRRSTKADVSTLLGEPAGKVLLPTTLFDHPKLAHLRHVIPTNAREAWCYYYHLSYFRVALRKRFEYYKFLAVYFDAAGIAVDKFYGESDKTEPKDTPAFAP